MELYTDYKSASSRFTITFLTRNAHEVGHIPQLKDGNTRHIIGSIKEYAQNILSVQDWHDGSYSIKEQQADVGENNFIKFNDFINEYYGNNKLKKLLEKPKNSEEVKIKRINTWWNKYNEKTKGVQKNNK